MKSKIILSLLAFATLFASCGKYSTSEKEVIKQKIFAMYDQVPKMTMENATSYDFNASNAICREIIKKDPILVDFFTYIFIDQKSETGVLLTIDLANLSSIPIQFLIEEELKLSEEEFERIRVAKVLF
jgi:hypothetical protein